MNIRKTFLELTSQTYPYGFESDLERFLPKGVQVDEDDNYFIKIGESKTVFAAHLDTACKDQTPVVRLYKNDIIRTDGKTILGADDKAGVTVLLYMIENKIPGLYYFFIGEEVGCIGSGAASKRKDFFKEYDRIVSFDRRGTNSIITHQSAQRTCSDDFARSLQKEFAKNNLVMYLDTTGSYTDSAEFTKIIPECTNISVGYLKEHTFEESQDIAFLEKLCKSVINIEWENLKVSRNPNLVDYDLDPYDEYYYGYGWASRKGREEHRKKIQPKQIPAKSSYGSTYDATDDFYTSYDEETAREIEELERTWGVNKTSSGGGKKYFDDLTKVIRHENGVAKVIDVKSDKQESEADGRNKYYLPLKTFVFDDHLNERDFEVINDQYLGGNG